MIKIALTGDIASGKSTAQKIIENMGFKVYDLDIISHELLNGECKKEVLKEFNTTDRKKLASIVFSNKDKLIKLESIIYPYLREFIKKTFEENENEKAVFISGALILDKGFGEYFDKVIATEADSLIRLKRLMKRNNYTEEEAKQRITAQENSKNHKADYIIENNQSETELEKKVVELLKKLDLI